MARNATIHIAVRSDIKVKFAKIADEYGMTMSALASYIIGQYVYNHAKFIDPLSDDIRHLVMDKVNTITDDVIEQADAEGEGRG